MSQFIAFKLKYPAKIILKKVLKLRYLYYITRRIGRKRHSYRQDLFKFYAMHFRFTNTLAHLQRYM